MRTQGCLCHTPALVQMVELFVDTVIVYGFASTQQAYRFLNALKHWSEAEVDARYHADNHQVRVTYQYDASGFDRTSAKLDDLAAEYEGREIG